MNKEIKIGWKRLVYVGFLTICLFILAPSQLGAFYLSTSDDNLGRINSIYPIDQAQFGAPTLAPEGSDLGDLVSLTAEETTVYNKYKEVITGDDGKLYWSEVSLTNSQAEGSAQELTPVEVDYYKQYKQVINMGGKLYWANKETDSETGDDNQLNLGGDDSSGDNNASEVLVSEEPEQEPEQVPPGIAKQGERKHADEGRHLGWQIGKHNGWDKKEEVDAEEDTEKNLENQQSKDDEESGLDLNLLVDEKNRGKVKIKPEGEELDDKPKLAIDNIEESLSNEANYLSSLSRIGEIKLGNGKGYRAAGYFSAAAEVGMKIRPLPIGRSK